MVSIHAPAWGATNVPSIRHAVRCCFNPRTRMGCDPGMVRGGGGRRCFNPRTRMGCDVLLSYSCTQYLRFQSTHPHGVRPAKTADFFGVTKFQSTHPHGVRPAKTADFFGVTKFQSTHPHGVRRHDRCVCVG